MGMNVVYNDTETREVLFVVNGRDGSSSLDMTGHRCLENCESLEPVEENEPTGLHYWSDPATWLNLPMRIPLEGEEVHIEDGWDVIYDIGTSPVFQSVQINGKLTFKQGEPALL